MSHKFFKRNILKFIIPFFVAATFVYVNHENPVQVSAWSGTQTSMEGNYYASVGNETGDSLKNKLKSIISSPKPSTSYDWSRYEAADEAEGASDSVLLIYSRKVVKKTAQVSGSQGWNREHSFPKSKIGSPATSDNHHIFADDVKTNSTRGNFKFGVVAQTSNNRVKDSYGDLTDSYYASSVFMPNPAARGEVARATMYLTTMYNYQVTSNFDSVALMLEWHLENPVTNRDIYRNNTVHRLQGNRNPYVDHPEYACSVWGGTNSATQSLCAASSGPVDVASVALTPKNETISLQGSTSLQMNATILPNNATNKALTWTSSNPSVATVSSSGTVLAKTVGTTIITATSAQNPTLKDSATITVNNNAINVTGVTISGNTTVGINKKIVLNADILPANATNKNVTWQSSHPVVASVSSDGEVKGLKVGSSSITVRTEDGNKTASVLVSVVVAPTFTSVVGDFRNNAGNNDGVENFTVNNLNNGVSNSYLGFGGNAVIKSFSKEKLYLPRNGGLAVGSGSSAGYLNLTLNDAFATKKVDVLFDLFGNTTSDIKLKGASGVASTQTNGTIGGNPYSVSFDDPQKYIEISSSKRVIIVEIVIYLEVEEEDNSLEEATLWSREFLDSTAEGCATSDYDDLYSAWQLAEDSFSELSEEAQAIIRDTHPLYSEEDDISHGKARYEVIKESYEFYDFISEEKNFIKSDINNKTPSNPGVLIIITVLGLFAILSFFFLKKTTITK